MTLFEVALILSEACLYVVQADDQACARAEIGHLITGLLSGMRAAS